MPLSPAPLSLFRRASGLAAVVGVALVVLVAFFSLASPADAARQTELDADPRLAQGNIDQRADLLMTSLGLDRTAAPVLFAALVDLETRTVATEVVADEWSGRVNDGALKVYERKSALDESRKGAIAIAVTAGSDELTEEVIAARDRLADISASTNLALRDLAVAEQALEADKASLARSLEKVMASWNLRQELVADLKAQIAHIEDAATQPGVGLPDARFASRIELALASATNADGARANGELFSFGAAGIRKVAPLLIDGDEASAYGDDANTMRWPSIGEVNSPFGMRVHPVYRSYRMHTGIDIDGEYGDPVSAAQDGVVTSAGWQGGYGITIEIDHGGGTTSLYSHLAEMSVEEGDAVKRSDTIGLVGTTGTTTGAHLHFEILQNDEPVDPLDYLP